MLNQRLHNLRTQVNKEDEEEREYKDRRQWAAVLVGRAPLTLAP